MRYLLTILCFIFVALPSMAQVPQAINYQMTVRDSVHQLLTNQNIGLQFSIKEDFANGTSVYHENHFLTTNNVGLANLKIGEGQAVLGTYGDIDWLNHNYFVEIGIDHSGGSSFSSLGTVQFVTVPFAEVARNVINKDDADADPSNEIQVLSVNGNTISLSNGGGSVTVQSYTAGQGISINNNIISNTAPDQTVSISGSGSTSVTGNYPNFNISSTDNIDDADSDPTNELQDLSSFSAGINRAIDITGGIGTSFDVADNDNDPTNELQNWGNLPGIPPDIADGDDVGISSEADPIYGASPANTITNTDIANWNNDLVNDADANPLNEIQTISISNDTIFLENGGFVVLPEVIVVFENAMGVVRNKGANQTDDFVFGAPTLDFDGNVNHAAKLFYDKSKRAFRVGFNSDLTWNEDSLGIFSFATGANTLAKGWYSAAFGISTSARGSMANAFGWSTISNGNLGFAIGRFNDPLVSPNSSGSNNPLFMIGNGTSNSNRNNALTVYESGRVEFNEQYSFPLTDGSINQVLGTDGNGNLDWVTNGTSLDVDFFKVGTSSSPSSIYDNIYTMGLVGINKTSPAYHLDVNGSGNIQNQLYFAGQINTKIFENGGLFFQAQNNSASDITFLANDQFTFQSNGGFRISNLYNNTSTTGGEKMVVAQTNGTLATLPIPTGGSGYWTLNGTFLYPNVTSQRIAIGHNTPLQALDVNGNITTSGNIYFDNDPNKAVTASSQDIYIKAQTGTGSDIYLNANNKVYVNSDDDQKFIIVNGEFYVQSNNVQFTNLSGTGTRMVVADASGNLSTQTIPSGGGGSSVWSQSGNDVYLSSTSSKVGIGTSNPQGGLDARYADGPFIAPNLTASQASAYVNSPNGAIFYLTSAGGSPFTQANKFYFKENGTWVVK